MSEGTHLPPPLPAPGHLPGPPLPAPVTSARRPASLRSMMFRRPQCESRAALLGSEGRGAGHGRGRGMAGQSQGGILPRAGIFK